MAVMRRIVAVSLTFALIIFMCLTALNLFGQDFADGVRHFLRDW